MQTDPTNYAKEPREIVEQADGQIRAANAAAPRYFGRLPKAPVEVRAVEPYQEAEAPPAFYFPPAPDGSRGGIYYVNTYQPESRPLHRLASTTFHEATPGHHFQITIEGELERAARLPALRRPAHRSRLRRRVGSVQRASGRRDGPLRVGLRAGRHARGPGLAGRAPGGRHRYPRLPLDARPVGPAAARHRPVAARGRDRNRSLHHLARPGAVPT